VIIASSEAAKEPTKGRMFSSFLNQKYYNDSWLEEYWAKKYPKYQLEV